MRWPPAMCAKTTRASSCARTGASTAAGRRSWARRADRQRSTPKGDGSPRHGSPPHGSLAHRARLGEIGAMSISGNPLAALEFEIIEEQASSLGRAGRRLEAAIAALNAFDAPHAGAPLAGAVRDDRRRQLVAEASEALWYLMVQRDACR